MGSACGLRPYTGAFLVLPCFAKSHRYLKFYSALFCLKRVDFLRCHKFTSHGVMYIYKIHIKRLLPCKPFYLIAHLKGVRMKKILTSALSLSLLACACSPKVQGDNYEDLMSSAEKISKEGILDGDIDYRLLQFAINYLVAECLRDGELKKHSIDDESFDGSKKDTCAKELDGRRAKDLIQEARDDFGKFPRSSSLIEFIKWLDKDLFKEYEKNALTSWGDSDPKSLEKFLEERKKEFIPMFGGILKSCLEESAG